MAELVRGIGDGPVNDGERRVVRKLADELPAGWKLLPNIEIRARNRRMLEIDCVVAAPHAVYLLEIKDWRGEIEGDDNTWVHNGRSQDSPNKQINYKAKVLKELLRAADPDLGSSSVESFVVLAQTPERLELSDGARAHTVALDAIVFALRDTSRLPGRPRTIARLPDRTITALAPLARERRPPSQIGGWRVLEQLGQDDDSTTYLVANALSADGPVARMTVWHLSSYRLTDQERSRKRKAIVREFVAVQRMGPHRLVTGARDAFEDGDDVVIVTDEPVGMPLALRLASGPAPDPTVRLAWIADLADAISHAHAHGVIHRRITAETVLVAPDGVRLSGFGHARIIEEGTIRHDPESVEGRDAVYLAPEAIDPSLGPATEKADVFGLAAVAWTIWSAKPLPPGWQASGAPARSEGMPDGLWAAVENLLDVRPDRRTRTLEEFRKAITDARVDLVDGSVPVAPAEYQPGELIADRYEVVEKLGSGGFAVVYRTIDREIDVERAVKVLDVRAGDSGVREIRALEKVVHPNVLRVRHIERTRTAPPQWFITSDVAPGVPLSGLAPLPLDEAAEIADQLLHACEAFHPGSGDRDGRGEGLVHRDIKPMNVLYHRERRHATLIDFNIASAAGATVVTMAGTPGYQPPDPDPDHWSPDADLFAIGVLLFELLTGDHPYADGRNSSSGVRSLVSLLPSAPIALSRFLDKATNPSRSARFTSAARMRAALAQAMTQDEPATVGPVTGTEPRGMGADPDMGPVTVAVSARTEVPVTVRDPSPTHAGSVATLRTPDRGLEGAEDAPVPRARPRWRIRLLAGVIAAVVLGGGLAMGLVFLPADGSEPVESAVGTSTISSAPPTPPTTASPLTSPAAPPTTARPVEAAPNGQDCPSGFAVKGNISESGELIFHEPGWTFYDRTRPERCFVDAAAAIAAGFRASQVQ